MIEHGNKPPTAGSLGQDDEATTIKMSPSSAGTSVSPASTLAATSALPFVTVDDLLALQLVADPQICPHSTTSASGSGQLLAFVALCCNAEKNTTSSAIWLLESNGDKTESVWQATSGQQHDFAPCWSPDGRTLAFLSDRGGSVQLYLLPLHGSEARQVSQLRNGVTEYSWKPDGTTLLAHSPWKPADDRNDPDSGEMAYVYTRLDEQWDGLQAQPVPAALVDPT